MRRSFSLTLGILILGLGSACGTPNPDPAGPVRAGLQSELEDFALPGWNRKPLVLAEIPHDSPFVPAAGPAVTEYRRRLADDGEPWGQGPVWHQMGTLPLVLGGRTEKLGVNVFSPAGASKGTLLFVHGYLSHSANFAYTFAWFVSEGWTVVTLDLPGHGLSTGPRGDVTDFKEYGDAVRVWLDWVDRQGWPGRRVLVAHSLGTAACLEALRRPGAPRLDQIVFCAPLLRPDWYPLLVFGEALLGGCLKELPSTFAWDKYLDGAVMPVHWFHALGLWLKTLETQPALDLPLTIFSGDRDDVVDEGWNRDAYRRLVPGARYVTLPGKGHLFLSDGRDREAFQVRLWETVALGKAP